MRLAGSIAWPMKPDRIIEVTSIQPLREPGQAVYAGGHLSRLFKPVYQTEVGGISTDGVVRGTTALGTPGKVEDGREKYMRKTIGACLIQLVGQLDRVPTAQELFDLAWPQFEEGADLTPRPGKAIRGPEQFRDKVIYTLRRFIEGKICGIESLRESQGRVSRETAGKGLQHCSAR